MPTVFNEARSRARDSLVRDDDIVGAEGQVQRAQLREPLGQVAAVEALWAQPGDVPGCRGSPALAHRPQHKRVAQVQPLQDLRAAAVLGAVLLGR